MRPFIVKQLDYDLTPVAGLALVGHHLNRLARYVCQILSTGFRHPFETENNGASPSQVGGVAFCE